MGAAGDFLAECCQRATLGKLSNDLCEAFGILNPHPIIFFVFSMYIKMPNYFFMRRFILRPGIQELLSISSHLDNTEKFSKLSPWNGGRYGEVCMKLRFETDFRVNWIKK